MNGPQAYGKTNISHHEGNANQNDSTTWYLLGWLLTKRQDITNAGEGVGNETPSVCCQ